MFYLGRELSLPYRRILMNHIPSRGFISRHSPTPEHELCIVISSQGTCWQKEKLLHGEETCQTLLNHMIKVNINSNVFLIEFTLDIT